MSRMKCVLAVPRHTDAGVQQPLKAQPAKLNGRAERLLKAKKAGTSTLQFSLWLANPSGVSAVAVNTPTAAGVFGASGVIAASGTNVEPEIFAEAAVPLSTFGTDVVGSLFWGTVITRASGSGGTSSDIKDLAGPVDFFIPTQ